MASAHSKTAATGGLHLIVPVFLPVMVGSAAYAISRVDWRLLFTGPGRYSRLALLLFIIANWKDMPLAWTTRIFYALLHHSWFFRRKVDTYPPRTLFHPSITSSRATLLETDYNMHKSNSTYFADLDASRSHLVTHLLMRGIDDVAANPRTKLVRDPSGEVVAGTMGIMLGSVHTSFKREIPPFTKYEMWSRVLAWDRKWLYIVTHFVQAGTVRPKGWDWIVYGGKGRATGNARNAKQAVAPAANGHAGHTNGTAATAPADAPDFQRRIYASSISRYVFKLGRFTVHPAIPLEASRLLPPRPGGGWRGGPNDVGDESAVADLLDGRHDSSFARLEEVGDATWDWTHTEVRRQRGMRLAAHFAALDGLHEEYDGGVDGALGRFPYG